MKEKIFTTEHTENTERKQKLFPVPCRSVFSVVIIPKNFIVPVRKKF